MKLEALLRDKKGTSATRRDRGEGFIPANLYGRDIENKNIKVKKTDLDAVIRDLGSNAIVELNIDGDSERAIIKDAQRDIIQYELVHVDFQKIEKGQKLKLMVPVALTGDDYEIDGGILEQHMDEIEIESIPSQIPREIVINVEGLGVGDSIMVSDVVADGFEILSNLDDTIVTVTAHQEPEEDEEPGADEPMEPVVIGEESAE